MVALAGTGAGSGRGGCSGGGFGSAAPRPERGHPLRGSLGQDELLPQLQVGPSSCCRGERKQNSALEGFNILIRAQEAPGLGAASLGISPSPSLRAARFSCSALKPWISSLRNWLIKSCPRARNSHGMLDSSLVEKHPDGL